MDSLYDRQLRNLKSESKKQDSFFSRMWPFGQKKQSEFGRLDIEGGVEMESKSLISGVKDGFFSKTEELQSKVTSAIDTGHNYYAFGAFFVVGALFLLLSFTMLPLIFISPNKFNLFFSLGSFFIQLSLAFFHGPLNYIKILFKKENMVISGLYFGALVFSVYTSLFWGTYLTAILLVLIQMVSLAYFLMQTFTGGETATKQLQSMVMGGVVNKLLVTLKLKKEEKNLFEF